jgi:hypothetical protein
MGGTSSKYPRLTHADSIPYSTVGNLCHEVTELTWHHNITLYVVYKNQSNQWVMSMISDWSNVNKIPSISTLRMNSVLNWHIFWGLDFEIKQKFVLSFSCLLFFFSSLQLLVSWCYSHFYTWSDCNYIMWFSCLRYILGINYIHFNSLF